MNWWFFTQTWTLWIFRQVSQHQLHLTLNSVRWPSRTYTTSTNDVWSSIKTCQLNSKTTFESDSIPWLSIQVFMRLCYQVSLFNFSFKNSNQFKWVFLYFFIIWNLYVHKKIQSVSHCVTVCWQTILWNNKLVKIFFFSYYLFYTDY